MRGTAPLFVGGLLSTPAPLRRLRRRCIQGACIRHMGQSSGKRARQQGQKTAHRVFTRLVLALGFTYCAKGHPAPLPQRDTLLKRERADVIPVGQEVLYPEG